MFSKQDIEKYFLAEKQLGIVFIIIGALAIVLALVFFLVMKTSFYKGAAIPLLVIGLVQLAASIPVYKNSDKLRIRYVYAYDMNPAQIKDEELPRMTSVLKKFAVIKWVEVVLMITGLVLIYNNRNNPEKAFWYGVGITLTLQVLIMLFADYSAERRAKNYTSGIERFIKK